LHMDAPPYAPSRNTEQDSQIAAAVRREGGRVRSFIRHRVSDAAEAEDILQEVLYELVSAYRLMHPIEQVGAWLMRVARNRVIDHFRRKKTRSIMVEPASFADEDEEGPSLEELLPSIAPGPEGEVVRQMLLEQIEDALDELPREQREVFIAHELEGHSFAELAERTGESINTLLARKHYAVRALRTRLQQIHDDWITEEGASNG